MNIVFNINPLGMDGLGVSLASLVRNCSDCSKLTLNFLCAGLSVDDKRNIEKLLESEQFSGSIRMIDVDARKEFGHLRSLHGDWTTYGRLLMPDLISADRALYLDADLSINCDILEIDDGLDFEGRLLAAVTQSSLRLQIDREFLKRSAGMDDDTPYFNAGVIYFNLAECRKQNAARAWRDFADAHKGDLISHDQSILNGHVKGDFVQLDVRFNLPWIAEDSEPEAAYQAVVHFVGAPKPWDFAGAWLHLGFDHWSRYDTQFWRQAYRGFMLEKLRRTWHIRRSIARVIKRRALGNLR